MAWVGGMEAGDLDVWMLNKTSNKEIMKIIWGVLSSCSHEFKNLTYTYKLIWRLFYCQIYLFFIQIYGECVRRDVLYY